MRFTIPFRSTRPPMEESIRPPREEEAPGGGYGAPTTAATGERVLEILPNLVKPRSLGRRSVYSLIITDRRLIFARATPVKKVAEKEKRKLSFDAIRKRREVFEPANYWGMDPEAILRQTLVNFALDIRDIQRVRARVEIPFVLNLEPGDLLKRDLDSEWDDIVHEIPDIRRRGNVKEYQEDVDMAWKLRIESVRADLSFILDYDPRQILERFLADKME